MRVLIPTQYGEGILTRPLKPAELAALVSALDGAARVKGSSWSLEGELRFMDDDPEAQIKFVHSNSGRVPAMTLQQFVAEKKAEKEREGANE